VVEKEKQEQVQKPMYFEQFIGISLSFELKYSKVEAQDKAKKFGSFRNKTAVCNVDLLREMSNEKGTQTTLRLASLFFGKMLTYCVYLLLLYT